MKEKFTPVYIVSTKKEDLEKLKKSVMSELKYVTLTNKDRNFLLSLIELFDWLSPNEDERFLAKLEKLALAKDSESDEEFRVRMKSLKMQLDANKNLKTINFPTFSMYFQEEKVEVYLKKLPASWDLLIAEIDKIDFSYLSVNVYKSVARTDKLLSTKLKKTDKKEWRKALETILDQHIHTNTKITLYYKKQQL